MSRRNIESSFTSIESCALHLRTWRPFHSPSTTTTTTSTAPFPLHKTQDSDSPRNPSTSSKSKRPFSFPVESLDFSKLTLFDDDRSISASHRVDSSYNLFARKRRRKGSRSLSGRSSDRSGTRRRRYCSVGTCSDFPMPLGTDSSGEMFMNGDVNWSSDVSEKARNVRNGKRGEKCGGGGVGGERVGEKENGNLGAGYIGNFDCLGNESGYGSEPGYRGDAEFGDGDEIDEEEDYPRVLFWDNEFGGNVTNPKRASENTLQKTHHRCRRKKHDLRMVDPIG